MKTPDEVIGDAHAIFRRSRLGITDVVLFVRVHLPLVQRVRLLDVDRDEPHPVTVPAVEILNALDRAPERGSGKAPENEDAGAAAP